MASRPMKRLAQTLVRARWLVIAALFVITAVFGSFIPTLKADFTPSDLFANFGDARQVEESFHDTFGNTDNVVLVLVEAPDVTTPENLGYLYTLTKAVSRIDGVRSAQSIATLPTPPQRVLQAAGDDGPVAPEHEMSVVDAFFDLYDVVVGSAILDKDKGAENANTQNSGDNKAGNRFKPLIDSLPVSPERAALVRTVARLSPVIDGRLLAHDRTVASIVVFLNNDLTHTKELKEVVGRFNTVLHDLQPPDEDVTVSLGGLPYIRTTVVQNMSADQAVLLPLSIIVSLLILFMAFRWLPALVLPIIGVGMSAVIFVGGMALFGQPLDILNNIIPTLVVLIGISSTIHIINRYRDNIAEGQLKKPAAADAMATMVLACFLTSATTAIGFASLGVSKTQILQRFGLTAGVGVMIAYVVVIFFVPTALTVFPAPKVRKLSDEQGSLEDRIEGVIRWILRYRVAVLVLACCSIVLALVLGWHTKVDSAVLDQVNPHDEVYRTTRLIEEKLGGFRPLEVYVRTDSDWGTLQPDVINGLAKITAYAKTQDGVLGTLGYTDLLHETERMLGQLPDDKEQPLGDAQQLGALVRLMQKHNPNPLASWLRNDGKSARIQIMVRDMGAHKTNLLIDRLEHRIDALAGSMDGVNIRLTGDAYVGSRGLDAVIGDLLSSLATAVIIIFILLALLFRSLRLGLISIPPALMPLAFTLCWMYIRGIPLNTATAIIFSIAIGMTVDGCIHFMTRFREEYTGDTLLDEAIVNAARSTGKAIIFTCVALIVGFGVMLMSEFIPIRRFGELVAFTISVMLVATMLVLPALLRVGYTLKEKKRRNETYLTDM